MEEIVFKEFYEDILKDAVRALEKRMADWSVYVEDSVYSDFRRLCLRMAAKE